jgi:hypothetical protein
MAVVFLFFQTIPNSPIGTAVDARLRLSELSRRHLQSERLLEFLTSIRLRKIEKLLKVTNEISFLDRDILKVNRRLSSVAEEISCAGNQFVGGSDIGPTVPVLAEETSFPAPKKTVVRRVSDEGTASCTETSLSSAADRSLVPSQCKETGIQSDFLSQMEKHSKELRACYFRSSHSSGMFHYLLPSPFFMPPKVKLMNWRIFKGTGG